MPEIALCDLDVLPALCALSADVDMIKNRVRFTAVQITVTGETLRESEPSGWFSMDDCPIRLTWTAFDFGES